MATTTEKPKARPLPSERPGMKDKPKAESKPTTEYVVLARTASGDVERFDVLGLASGVTDTKAIETVRAKLPESQQGLAFVAVPSRSWRLRTPKIETTTRTLWT